MQSIWSQLVLDSTFLYRSIDVVNINHYSWRNSKEHVWQRDMFQADRRTR